MDATLFAPADPAAQDYARFHAPRYAYTLNLLADFVGPKSRVLDVGWSALTGMIHDQFGVPVDALGFDADGETATGDYYHFDLNDCQSPQHCRGNLPTYDVIVFAEVIEHLHTAPTLVLGFLADLLRPGGVIIVQTPNAVALPRRVKMLFGRNPYELIREDDTNPGHFREYTAAELRGFAAAVGLTCERVDLRSYFDYRYARHGKSPALCLGAVKNAVYPWLPQSLRPGLTVVYRRRGVARAAPPEFAD